MIVVLNTANAMEMGFLEEYGIEACVWAGEPGTYGFTALGQILSGEINPSGKLPDTWVYDNYSAPASENYGDQAASNSDVANYLDYVEGIYVGYRWYETAYAEKAVVTNTKTGVTYDFSDYDSIVAFPFGYGLSYTSFSQEITGGTLTEGTPLDARETYTIDIEVTNTGDTAGKDAVQVYVTVPYTDDNGDDTNGAYMLDAGDYVFSVRQDAHNEYDSVTGTMSEQYFYSGETQRDSDEQAACNQFEDAARGEYLSTGWICKL